MKMGILLFLILIKFSKVRLLLTPGGLARASPELKSVKRDQISCLPSKAAYAYRKNPLGFGGFVVYRKVRFFTRTIWADFASELANDVYTYFLFLLFFFSIRSIRSVPLPVSSR